MTTNAINGAVIYRGPSMLDGAPIVAIATGLRSGSANSKTGDMVQTWIMRADMAPHFATREGTDASVCGDCRHRGEHDGHSWVRPRTCYVLVHNAPLSVWRAERRGNYPDVTGAAQLRALGAGRVVRIGSYGDPAAVPVSVWKALTARASGWTGYTHQWRGMHPSTARAFRPLVMASADTPAERDLAQSKGWRTFRVSTGVEESRAEILCPASEEGRRRTTCADCQLCMGATSRAAKSVYIPVHGSGAGAFRRAAA